MLVFIDDLLWAELCAVCFIDNDIGVKEYELQG